VWEPFSPERVSQLRASGRVVFVDFTAAWCLTCQVNERAVLSSDRVVDRLRQANVATVKADWTQKDETITRALAEHGRQGVPLYVLYVPGAAAPVLLPEVLTEDLVLDALSRL
jgi:thiol:disulfide interchange protein